MSDKNFAAGQCLCGQVSYVISSEPLKMMQCHCDDCRKSTGTGHVSMVFFYKDQVEISGDVKGYDSVTDSGSTITRYFCPTCGSSIFGMNSTSKNVIGVAAGTLDDSSWFKPEVIVFNKRKPDWDFMDETVPTFEGMPPPPNKK